MAGSFEGEEAKAHVKLTGQRADVNEACDLQQAWNLPNEQRKWSRESRDAPTPKKSRDS